MKTTRTPFQAMMIALADLEAWADDTAESRIYQLGLAHGGRFRDVALLVARRFTYRLDDGISLDGRTAGEIIAEARALLTAGSPTSAALS